MVYQTGVYHKAHFKISGYKRLHAYDNPAVMMSAAGDHSKSSSIGIDISFHQCLLIIQIIENSSTTYFSGIPAFRSVPKPTQLRCQFQLTSYPKYRQSDMMAVCAYAASPNANPDCVIQQDDLQAMPWRIHNGRVWKRVGRVLSQCFFKCTCCNG